MSSSESDTLQSPQMRKYILRSALKTAQTLSENVNKNTIANLESIMYKTDILASESKMEEIANDHEEVVLDAHVISLSSHIMRRCTLNVTKEIDSYVYEEFAENIKNYLIRQSNTLVEEANWSLLENYVMKNFQITPNFQSLQGCMDPFPIEETNQINKTVDLKNQSIYNKDKLQLKYGLSLIPKEVFVKRQINRDPKFPTKRPKCIYAADKAEESVEDSVEKIKCLVNSYYENNDKPLHFFKLVLHPTDFGRTIENLLHTSFLLRDGIFKLVKDEKGALLVEIVPKKVLHAAKKSGKQIGIQNVFSINKEEWRILISNYNIKKPMINFDEEN